jgi:hypothetical protein
MRQNIVSPSPVTARPYESDLYCLPVAAVPYVLGALALRMSPYWYSTPEDYARGRSLLAEFSGGLLMGCAQELIVAVNRVEARLDATLNGNARSLTGTGTAIDPYVFTPPLGTEFDPTAIQPPSLREDTQATRALLDNLITGAISAYATDPRTVKDQLQEIIDKAAGTGEFDAEILAKLTELVLLAA